MGRIVPSCLILAAIASPAMADLDSAVADAVAAVEGAQPAAMWTDQVLSQVDGCTLEVTSKEIAPASYETGQTTISADFSTLDFASVQRAPVPTDGFEGVMLLIPTVDMQPTASEALKVTGADSDMQDAVIAMGGTCSEAACEGTSPSPFIRVAVMTETAATDTDTILAALSAVGAECGATGL